MNLSRNFLAGKRNYLLGLIILLFTSVLCLAFNITSSDDFDASKRGILLRRIGHELLLQSGDSTSQVLPVKKIGENEFQISFKHELTFQPDSLVNLTGRLLAKDPLANDYIVNVLNCGDSSVAYGFAISKNKKDDIITCKGRVQPRACYTIDIKFKPTGINTLKNGYLLSSLPFLAFVGFIFFRNVKHRHNVPNHNDVIHLGKALFDTNNRKLLVGEKTIDLTGTESRILLIFALSPNETIARSRLQKEIWEDEGVIVGRSLDMFISKLRKKLEVVPNISIVVVRGVGYRIDIKTHLIN